MGYTRSDILGRCYKAFKNKNTFYKKDFINYRGKTTDTNEYYTEIIAEFLLNHITEYKTGIDCITRKTSYKTAGHDGIYDPASIREEEIIAMKLYVQSKQQGGFHFIGTIEDYQTPLKSNANDEAGKIDLLSFNGNTVHILELKKPDSKETMLRCVLEGYTYLQTADCNKLLSDFGYDPTKIVVKASPLIFYNGAQHHEMIQTRPYLLKLMSSLDCKPYYILGTENYTIVED